MKTMKTYEELSKLKTFRERFEYLKIGGQVANSTFGGERYLNQALYTSGEWKDFRRKVIIRDNGCDLGIEDHKIIGKIIIVHHINPLTAEDFKNRSNKIFDMNNVICVTDRTHKAIHYGSWDLIDDELVERRPNDTCPWLI